jgi:glutathione S-transferase
MLKIYGTPISIHARKVIVAALHKGLEHEVIPVVPTLPETLPSNWRELSPAGLIPVLTDGDFTLTDSGAICAYFDSTHPNKPLYPKGVRERARTLALEAFASDSLYRALVRPLLSEVFIEPKIKKSRPTNPDTVNHLINHVAPDIFAFLNHAAAGEYLVGGQLTMADIAVVSNLLNFEYGGFDLDRRRYGNLGALFDRVVAEPAMREALRQEVPIVEFVGLRSDGIKRWVA